MRNKIMYWISTLLLSALMFMSAGMYFFKNPMVQQMFKNLGYPTYIIYPLAFAKILGVLAILTRKVPFLKELAYAGFFFEFILAFSAHINAADGEYTAALIALILLIISYIYDKKIFKTI